MGCGVCAGMWVGGWCRLCVCGVGKDVLRRQEGRHHVGQRALMPPSAQRWPLAGVTVPASPAWCGEAGPCELLGVQPKGAGLQRAWGGEQVRGGRQGQWG